MAAKTNKADAVFACRAASLGDMDEYFAKRIAEKPDDERRVMWRNKRMEDNASGKCQTFFVFRNDEVVGQGTLLFAVDHASIRGRTELANGVDSTNINALRIEKEYEGQGHISRLVKEMERYAAERGYVTITIGVEACEARNLGIYLHWGYTTLVHSEIEENDSLVLYYAKPLAANG